MCRPPNYGGLPTLHERRVRKGAAVTATAPEDGMGPNLNFVGAGFPPNNSRQFETAWELKARCAVLAVAAVAGRRAAVLDWT